MNRRYATIMAILIASLGALALMLIGLGGLPGVQARTIAVDAVNDWDEAGWEMDPPAQANLGHIGRDPQWEGEYIWNDAWGDERTDFDDPDTRVDLTEFRVTADGTNLYFMAVMSDINQATGNGAPQVQIAIDVDLVNASGEIWLGGNSDTQVDPDAAWEYLLITRFGSGNSDVIVWQNGFSTQIFTGTESISTTTEIIEFSIPWTALEMSEPPTLPLRFTLATFRANTSDETWDTGSGTSDALDALTNYGDPGLVDNTWAEVSDQVINYHFDLFFQPDGDVYPPLLISEAYYDATGSDSDNEWLEIYNAAPISINLNSFKIGDEETPDGGEGMAQFPSGYDISPGAAVVVALRTTDGGTEGFENLYGFKPDFEANDTDVAVPDMLAYGVWQTTPVFALGNSGDEILLLDGSDTAVDVVTYEGNQWPGVEDHAGVSTDQSIERYPVSQDTNDCNVDFQALDSGGDPANVRDADLSITKDASPTADVEPGDGVTYTLILRNDSDADASPVYVTDTLPVETDFGYWLEQPTGASVVNDEITWNGTVTASNAITFSFVVTNMANSGTVINTTLYRFTDQMVSDQASYTATMPTQPLLFIDKSADPIVDVAYQGLVTYTIDLENQGAGDAAGTMMTDTLPLSVTFAYWIEQPTGASEVGDEITWTGLVTANESVTFTFAVSHTGDYGDVVANTAEYTHTSGGGNDTATFYVEGGPMPDLLIAKSAVPTETFVREGEPALITYTIHITNAGNQQANNVELVDTPPFGFEYVTDTSGVTPTMMGDDIVWNLGTLTDTPGSNVVSFQLWMSATDAITLTGPYVNLAAVTADNDPVGDVSAAGVQINRVLPIHDIQYVDDPLADDASPWIGQHVWVEGVATASSDDFGGFRYFIEDPAGGPWSGLYVYHAGDREPVQEGDWLLLYGLVREYFGLTELDLSDSVDGEQHILSSGNPLPAPEVLATDTYSPTAVATAEAYEGVLLEFRSATVVSDDLGFGEWSFDDGSGEAHADDLSSSLVYTPTLGDYYVYIRGVGYYSFSEYKLAPRYDPDIMFPFTLTLAYHDLEDVVGTGEAIYLAGDFNGWDPLALPMTPDAGYETFSASLYITETGTYGYKYVVYTDTIPSGPANWNWLQSDNRSLTPEAAGTVHDYRSVQPGYVVLQSPISTTTAVGQPTEDILSQVWADDLTSRPGAPRALLAELGYGQDPNPATWTTWGDMAWSSQEGNNDQFSGVMTPTMAGVYSYVVRFNANWGPGNPNDAWSYGDSDGVHPGDPFEIGNAGVLTVTEPVTGPILSLTKSVDEGMPIGDEPDLGDPVTYTITLANDGETDAENVHVWDLPADPDCIDLQPLDWTGTVTAQEQIAFTIPATVTNDPACYGVRVDNTAYYSHTSGSDEDSAYFNVAEPNFLLTKNADPDTDVPYHSPVTYTIQLRNYGTTDAPDSRFTDTLPISVTFARWVEQPAGFTVVDDQITWHGTLTEGARIDVTFIVTHVGDYGETIRNTAELSHSTLSQVRTIYDDFTVESRPVSPSLSIDKLAYPDTDVAYHGEVTYTVTLNNSGTGAALGVTLTDSLPAEVTFARWLAQPAGADVVSDVVTWSGTVSGSSAIVFTFIVTHVGDYGDTVTNTAEYGYGQESSTASASFSVQGAGPTPQLSVDKQVSPAANVPLSSTVVYTISLSNSGDAAALGVVLTDVLPAEVSFGGWLVQNGADETDGTITWSGGISPTMDATLVFSATVVSGDPGADVSNVAQYASDNAGSGSDEAVLSLQGEVGYTIYLPIVLKNSQ